MINQQAKPGSMGFGELIQKIKSGKVKVPKFQRNFVWNINQTAELLDSMIKGYPIGTFILWETTARMNSVRDIGDLPKIPESPHGERVAYVLDGQQRITSLFAAHQGAEMPKTEERKATDYKEIFVDLRKNSETDGDPIVTTVKPDGEHVRLQDILHAFSGGNLSDLMDSARYSKGSRMQITQYIENLSGYQFSAIVLESDNMDVAIEVFTRINTSGKTLTLFEIMSAKTYDEKQRFDMHEKWEQVVEDCKNAKFESISSTLVLYILASVLSETNECKRKTILGLEKQKIINAWDDVVESLKKSIEHMRTSINVPVSGLLPYDSLLVPFAYFYYYKRKETPSEQQQKLLEEFFWWASLSHRYSAANESRLAQDIRKMDSILNEKAPSYEEKVDLHSPSTLIEQDFRASDSYCKAVLCLLAAEDPLDFEKPGARVTLDNSWLLRANSKNYHHFFPKKYLETQRKEHAEWHDNANSIMNITFVRDRLNKGEIGAKPPAEYIKKFESANSQLKQALDTHFINLEQDGIDDNDYGLFLQNRAKRVFEKLNAKLSEATRPKKA